MRLSRKGKVSGINPKNSVFLSIFCQVNDTPDPQDLLGLL